MARKVIIEASLVPESTDEKPEKIEREISRKFLEEHLIIPWCEKIEKVKIIDF